ncbi:MAG: hypothetical protein OQL19_18900 [Gammaproteobacteria bacterium]|nr:hypothetical protein [Gammaproteobacteria bacterium]
MKKLTVLLLLVFSLFSVTQSFSDRLVLSSKLEMDYPSPVLISHTEDTLIIKYENWSFLHNIVNPQKIYHTIDLTGLEKDYILSIFQQKTNSSFPEWLNALSREQAKEFGVTSSNVLRKKINLSEIVGVYDKKRSSGYLYVFDETKIHHFVIYGSEEKYNLLITYIKER